MKTQAQSIDEFNLLAQLIEPIPVSMMTTIDADHALVSRPMTVLEMDADGALWFFTDLRSSKVEQLQSVNLSFVDVDHGHYVSLSGHAEVFANPTRAEALWTEFARPWFPDGPESPNLALLKFVPAIAEYWDAPSSKMVRVLAMITTVDTGERIAVGEPARPDDQNPLLEHPTTTF